MLGFILISIVSFAAPAPKLNLNLVMSKALQHAQGFRALEGQKLLSQSFSTQSEVPFTWNLEFGYESVDDRNESATPVSPTSIKSTGGYLGFSKYFSSGTAVSAKLKQTENAMSFPAASGILVPDYKESTATLGLSQNLWKDAFGEASRRQHSGLEYKAQAQNLAYKRSRASYALVLINQYYGAWLAQQKLRSTKESHQRKLSLLKSTQIRLGRGTAEQTDLLQTESANLLSQSNLAQVQAELDQRWRDLIVILGLPTDYLAFPASQVFLDVGAQSKNWKAFCESQLNAAFEVGPEIEKAKLEMQAAEEQHQAAASQQKAELQLRAQLESNGINSSIAGSQSEAFGSKNPAWAVGIYWKKPLGSSAEDAQALQATAQQIQAQAQYVAARDEHKVALLKSCADWRDMESDLPRAEAAASKQTQRSGLEEKRFRLGRSTTFQVIQAGDDATQAQLLYQQLQVAKEMIHWRLMDLTGQLDSQLETWSHE